MKKLFTWALVAAVMTAGAAFAGPVSSLNAGRMFIQPNATFASGAGAFNFTGGVPATGSGPTTTNNDDSCDIGTAPAATLLLPYFEVDFRSPSTAAVNTNFTITNVSAFPQVAHVTIWTDRSFPVIDFNIYLTGYDVQGISLYDIIARGQIPPTGAAAADTNSPNGTRSVAKGGNPNFSAAPTGGFAASCASLPGPIPGSPAAPATVATGLLLDIQNALSIGSYSTCPSGSRGRAVVGSDRGDTATARGYVTVDVANTCSQTLPTNALYYTTEILFDNVLIGDYQRINPRAGVNLNGDAGGNPMVHIRAIPEGGTAGVNPGVTVNLPYTFYDRYTPNTNRKADRRQPLPGTFAARVISINSQATSLNIWREGTVNGPSTEACAVSANALIPISEIVRFDERENPASITPQGCQISPCAPGTQTGLPETSSTDVGSSIFPQFTSGPLNGWIYLNLNNGGSAAYSAARTNVPAVIANPNANPPIAGSPAVIGPLAGVSQNWVTITQSADAAVGRYSVEFDAAWLGNGCSPAPVTGINAPAIGPAGGAVNNATNVNP